jgi:uncharacterized protein
MIKAKHCPVVLFVLLSFGAAAFAQGSDGGSQTSPDEKTIAAARHVLDLTGAAKLGEQLWPTMFEALKRTQPSVPESAWEEIDREFRSYFSSDEFLNSIATVYARHFNEDELKQLAAFYETPLGKKVVQNLPEIGQECFSVGASAGRDLTQRALERLKGKGYKIVAD